MTRTVFGFSAYGEDHRLSSTRVTRMPGYATHRYCRQSREHRLEVRHRPLWRKVYGEVDVARACVPVPAAEAVEPAPRPGQTCDAVRYRCAAREIDQAVVL
jgi:hypothetical protein